MSDEPGIFREELIVMGNLIFKGERFVVPQTLRLEMTKIGTHGRYEKVQEEEFIIWGLPMNVQIEEEVKNVKFAYSITRQSLHSP